MKTRKLNNQPYNAKVFANDLTGKEIQKQGFSTFPPDSWSKEKIMEEVEYAVKNNRGLVDASKSSTLFKGFSKNGIEIRFAYEGSEIKTFYPFIK